MSQGNGFNGSNYATSGQQQQGQQYDNVQQAQMGGQQSLHMQLMQAQNHQQQPQSALTEENSSSSLVYDRTIKVAKTGYADHGSHGVAALPYPGQTNAGEAGAPGGLPSSVQMQLQMQQMAAAMMQQQQQQQQQQNATNHNHQQQQKQYQAMPPLLNNNGGMAGGGGTGNDLGGGGAPMPVVVNTTSSTGLMQALNAQIAANQAAINQAAMNNMAGVMAGGEGLPGGGGPMMVNQSNGAMAMGNGNLAQTAGMANVPSHLIGNMSTMANPNAVAGAGGRASSSSGSSGMANPDMMIAPGDIRNGKKRVSPSMPLHPSQLQAHHGVGGVLAVPGGVPGSIPGGVPDMGIPGMGGYATVPIANNFGMNAVAEEDELSSSFTGAQPPQKVLNSLVPAQQGLLGTALSNAQQQGINQSLELSASGQQPQLQQQTSPKNKQQKGKSSSSHNNADSSIKKEERHGEVLTNPSVPSANSGLDNAEGNLIVRRGDILRIPRKMMHSHPPSKNVQSTSSTATAKTSNKQSGTEEGHVEYRVVSLLGQGTFAQVFHCVDQESQKCLAVKIVKNKPAYTRQAAVEIDVFRKLSAVDDPIDGDSEATTAGDSGKSTKGATSGTTSSYYSSSYDSSTTMTNATATPSESVIRLCSYFMHHSHLCLVFEMLGPNLYELLKRRQFRGLPIGAVRTLIRQATEGIKLLGKRNVVHCDLKPENILMVRGGDDGQGKTEDVEAVINECKLRGEANASNSTGDAKSKASSSLGTGSVEQNEQYIKLIDFGSACFEGQTTHTYIQSRFYRSPEVLVGLPYDSAIDIWSLGCVAAELFLGLPILPGVHEHDQLGRILEMIGPIPEWMLENGSKSAKFFNSTTRSNNSSNASSHSFGPSAIYHDRSDSTPSSSTTWDFKSRKEYIAHLTDEEKRSKGGAAKLEQQQTNRYFKKKKLEDIVMHHGVCNSKKEREQLGLFVHFLKGVLDPDPWKRWTAHQASMHPFLTGSSVYRRKAASGDVGMGADGKAQPYEIHWQPPFDANVSKRKLLVLQKTKEKAAAAQAQQQAAANNSNSRRRRSLNESSLSLGRSTISQSVPETSVAVHPNSINMAMPPLSTAQAPLLDIYGSPLKGQINRPNLQIQPSPSAMSVTSQMAAMADAMSLERARSNISMGKVSPPQTLVNNGGVGGQGMYAGHPAMLSASLGGMGMPMPSYNVNLASGGRSLSENLMHPAEQQQLAAAQQQHLQSLSNLNDAAFLQPPPPLPPPPTFMGAQSFSGAYYQPGLPAGSHYPYVESELGYALQRPGVFPAGMMGGDGGPSSQFMTTPLRRQSSNYQQGQAMLSTSLSNLSSSTPQSYGMASGQMMNYQPTAVSAMSPGGLLLQQLGLQEQMMMANQSNATGTSLLAQQLEEFSQADPHLVQNSNPNQAGMMNSGPYLGGQMSMSLPQTMQSVSFSDVGSSIQQQQQQIQQLQHNLAQAQMQGQMHPQQMQMATSFPPAEVMYSDGGGSGQQQQNAAMGQLNNEGGILRRPAPG